MTYLSVALYDFEIWTLTVPVAKNLFTFEMAALRILLGVLKLDKIHNDILKRLHEDHSTSRLCNGS